MRATNRIFVFVFWQPFIFFSSLEIHCMIMIIKLLVADGGDSSIFHASHVGLSDDVFLVVNYRLFYIYLESRLFVSE